jgi:hypothetical protein
VRSILGREPGGTLKIWSRALAAGALIAAGMFACSPADLIDIVVPLDIDDGASEGAAASVKVDGSAEKTLSLGTGATLTVPKGAVDRELTLKVERPADEKAIALVKTLKSIKSVASAPYVLTPHGTEFKSAVTLELPVAKHQDRALAVAWLEDENDKEWKLLEGAKLDDTGKVKVELKHFSVVIVLDAARAGFDASVPGEDAGETEDAGEPEDAGETVDAGEPEDAGDPADSGSTSGPVDGGQDAAVTVPDDAAAPIDNDAGAAQDAGVDASQSFDASDDSSTSTDAEIQDPDAFVPPDAAGPDSGVPLDDSGQIDAVITA